MRRTGTTPLRVRVTRAVAGAGLLLVVCPFAVPSAGAQDATAREPIAGEANVPPTDLIGPWLRDLELSEAPNRRAESLWRTPEETPAFIRELVESLNDRLDSVLIEVDGKTLLLLNARAELSSFRLGREQYRDGPGNELRLATTRDTLRIETRISGWLWVETFCRRENQLVRVTEIRHTGFSGLKFRTVYDPVGSGHPWAAPAVDRPFAFSQPIRIVPPGRRRALLSGRVEFQTLIADPTVSSVEFIVNGNRSKILRRPPFRTRVELAKPPREQTVEVRAYNEDGEYLGGDRLGLNRIDVPFAIRIAGIHSKHANGNPAVRVEAGISLPRSAALERVEFYRRDRLVLTVGDFGAAANIGSARTIQVDALIRDVQTNDFVRVSAKLADGRELEDAQLLMGADYRSEIDVQLVQLQVLVSDNEGKPVGTLDPEDFAIVENGRPRRVENIHTAHDVPLVLGLAIDSSDSMSPIWRKLKHVVLRFLDRSLASGDRAFLVDFDKTVRLLQPLTGNKPLLSRGLDRLTPLGGTALNDGILFSLLQYRSEPGRRALVVITDGADLHSRSRPKQSVDFAERLGIPIYFLELDNLITNVAVGGGITPSSGLARLKQQEARKRLDRISRKTGGRLFHILPFAEGTAPTDRIEQVFNQIEKDLRHQHVLTYYSDQPLGVPVEPEIRMTRRGLSLRSAVPLEAIE